MHVPYLSCPPTGATRLYTLSLHDALPISCPVTVPAVSEVKVIVHWPLALVFAPAPVHVPVGDRKSARLNSSHRCASYAFVCSKKHMPPLIDFRQEAKAV